MVEKVLSLNKKASDSSCMGPGYQYNQCNSQGSKSMVWRMQCLLGSHAEIRNICRKAGIDHELFTVVDSEDEIKASAEAVRLTRSGEADIVMKGLVGTDKFLKAVMDKK
ncbi:MAG: hypothetical protein MZV63_19785 [Marinilabiliales bacterium]|nr:hypothetical protein [Marinilabiliales bacterium]